MSKATGVRATTEVWRQESPQRVETTRVAPVETTETAETMDTTE